MGLTRALDEQGALANALTEIMQLCAADFAFVGDFNLRDTRRVKREYAFDTFAIGNFADGKSGVDAAATLCDDEASKDLDTLLTSFDNPAMNFDGVSDVERGEVGFELLLFDFPDNIHGRGCVKRL